MVPFKILHSLSQLLVGLMTVLLQIESAIGLYRLTIFRFRLIALLHILAIGSLNAQSEMQDPVIVNVYPDATLNDVSHHPIGINVDFFMDNDRFLHPERSTADALKAMGVKYLRYPGGEKSDLYLFSKPPYDTSYPTLARTGKGAVGGYARVLNKDFSDFNREVLNFDNFIQLCAEVGAEPIVVVAADMYLLDLPAGNTLMNDINQFQIDGNFGATAGIAEMLLQSDGTTIDLLPALPEAWKEGEMLGLKARGNFEISMFWTNNKLDKVMIKSLNNNTCTLKNGEKTVKLNMKTNQLLVFNGQLKPIL